MQQIKKIRIAMIALLLSAPVIVSAQLNKPQQGSTGLPDLTLGQGIPGFIMFLVNIVLVFAGIVAVLFLIIGGYQYIVSAGNEELAAQGKKTIQNAIIGVVVIILSYTIVTVIFRTLTGS